MSNMGRFRIRIAVEHPARRGLEIPVDDVLVDTGSEYTWIPADILEQHGVERERVQRFAVADGRVLARRLVPAGPIITAAA